VEIIRRRAISNVFIDKWNLKSLLASAVEVYPRETMGLLWGIKSYRKMERIKKRCLSIKSVYPIQTVKRGYTQVDWGSQEAKKRLLNIVKAVEAGIVGEFHSHPKDGATSSLSADDMHYYLRESRNGREILGKDWIELVIRVNEIRQKSGNEEPVYGNYSYKKAERIRVNSGENTYDITLSAWFIKQTNDNEIFPFQGTVWIEWPII
jgi:proteasome lid subunit RPN8/RPN11